MVTHINLAMAHDNHAPTVIPEIRKMDRELLDLNRVVEVYEAD